MSKYLYGASVQGIQGFIFETNKLQEIVGASEIVKDINKKFIDDIKNYNTKLIMSAAGNMKAVFNNRDELQKFILEFKKQVLNMAYGITFSEAVIEIKGKEPNSDERVSLEENLKIQRNRPNIPLDLSLNITQLAPSTAKPVVKHIKIQNKSTAIDMATKLKREAYDNFKKDNPRNKEFSDISDFSNSKNKIAIIHIDGNGLGNIIKNLKTPISEFSKNLDDATKKAFELSRDDTMDIREVILGGDDVTVICNANNALDFTKNFLKNFEIESKNRLGTKLTACAGIAYCNEKYPFHYAIDLAEELCKETKKDAKKIDKDLAPSSLMFHNIQSSNYQSWNKFIEDELTIRNDDSVIRCDFGAYYLNSETKPTIENLMNTIEAYRCDGSPITRLRNWLSELYKSDKNAKNLLHRINQVVKEKDNWNCEIMDRNLKFFNKDLSNDTLIIEKDGHQKTPIYDILQILSVTEAKK